MCPDNPEYIGNENSGRIQIIQNTLEDKILDMSRKEDNLNGNNHIGRLIDGNQSNLLYL